MTLMSRVQNFLRGTPATQEQDHPATAEVDEQINTDRSNNMSETTTDNRAEQVSEHPFVSIEETVSTSLSESGYGTYYSHARPVLEALNVREDAIRTGLRAFARDRGL